MAPIPHTRSALDEARRVAAALAGVPELKAPEGRLAFLVSVVLALLTVPVYVVQWGGMDWMEGNPLTIICLVLTYLILIRGLAWCLGKVFRKLAAGGEAAAGSARLLDELFAWSPGRIALVSAGLFALWIPGLFAAYPCYMDWDTLNQLFQYATDSPTNYAARAVDIMVDAKFIDHDTLPTTLLFGAFWQVGFALGNQNLGLFLYATTQSILSACSLGVLCCYVRRWGLSGRAAAATFVFCALFPVFSRFAATMLKDSLFSPFFLLYTIAYVEVFRSRGAALVDKRFVVLFALFAIGCIESRKTGLYIVAISAVVLILCFRRRWAPIVLSSFGAIALCAVVVQGILYPALGVQSVGRQEVFAMPFQQSAAVALWYPDDVREWERDAVSALIDYDDLDELYNPDLADPIKNTFNVNASSEDVLRYLGAYLSQGLRHPIAYLKVALKLDGPMLVPMNAVIIPMQTCEANIAEMELYEGPSVIDFGKSSWAENPSSLIDHLSWWFIALLGPFGTMGFYGGWLPLIAFIVTFRRNRRLSAALVPVLLTSLTLVISPITVTRYVLPLIYCAPLLVVLMTAALRGSGDGKAA